MQEPRTITACDAKETVVQWIRCKRDLLQNENVYGVFVCVGVCFEVVVVVVVPAVPVPTAVPACNSNKSYQTTTEEIVC